ncbi:unnamed protein product, partial [Amoebophrya sp. A25]|eukprot:GSA25T00021460001.1
MRLVEFSGASESGSPEGHGVCAAPSSEKDSTFFHTSSGLEQGTKASRSSATKHWLRLCLHAFSSVI